MNKRNLIIVVFLLAGSVYWWQSNRHEHAPNEPAHAEDHHDHGKETAKDEHGHAHDEKAHEEKADAHGHEGEAAGHAHGEEGHEEEAGATIAPEVAENTGIKVEEATNALIHETIHLTGRTLLNENKTAQVKARFSGIVREVKKSVGETVTSGDVLAMVESNDSLQVYPVKAPIGGVVIARNTNVGDVAGEEPIFTITDTADVWAEFHIFPRDIDRIKTGHKILITSFEGGHTGEAAITTLLPLAEASSQTVVARVTLPNPDGLWRAGMTVRGDVVVAEHPAPVAVKTSAIQRMEGKASVFIQEGDKYETRHVTTGASDATWTEVLEGLKAGERYVSEKSFRVKADIGKEGAAHEH